MEKKTAKLTEAMQEAHKMYQTAKKYNCLKDMHFYHGLSEAIAQAIADGSIYPWYSNFVSEPLTAIDAERLYSNAWKPMD